MIDAIEFTNFKALRKTSLPLAPFTLLLGPNGSGKTTVLQALENVASVTAQQGSLPRRTGTMLPWSSLRSVTAGDQANVELTIRLRLKDRVHLATFRWSPNAPQPGILVKPQQGGHLPPEDNLLILRWLGRMEVYALNASAIAGPVAVSAAPALAPDGAGLAAVLDDLKDSQPERWGALLAEMCHWLPEYDQVLFEKPQPGLKGIVLRTRNGGHRIPARELSQGTLVALALLTLAYLPNPPTIIGLEEIDRGLHPRLLRHLQDALYRLSYPESVGEARPPIQVIATTHSPYLLDLYRDHPEEVVLAEKQGLEVQMRRLKDIEHYEEILGESPLSEVWYSGVLGGVSVKP
jgi:predicted ATPase